MNRVYRRSGRAIAGAGLVGLTVLGAVRIGEAQQPSPRDPARQAEQQPKSKSKSSEIDPRADALLKKTSEFLAKQQRFTVDTEGELEVVLDSGQKLEFPFASKVKVQRPNKLRADRRGAQTDLRLVYDGRQLVLHGKRANMFARTPAPPTLDAAIDHARATIGVDAPGADLLFADAYAGLIPDVVSATYLGTELVRGVECEHAAFRGREVDFQIWVRTGSTPTPCRYVVTTTGMQSQPEYAVDLVRWDLSPRFAKDEFAFQPPAGAEEISFLTAGEMKKHTTARLNRPAPAGPRQPNQGEAP